jgi:hypothetical protein
MPIHSKRVDLLLHHGSACNGSSVLIAFAVAMALRLPIHRSAFFAGGNISPKLPTNLL